MFLERQIGPASTATSVAQLVGTRTSAATGAHFLIRKWVDPLAVPPVATGPRLDMSMVRTTHRFHSSLAASSTLAFRCDAASVLVPGTPGAGGYLGPTIVATTGEPLTVHMVNRIARTGGHPLPIDTTVPGAERAGRDGPGDQLSPRTATHLHGGNSRPAHDGGPGDEFRDERTYVYDNTQDAAGLWYHDHAMGITRLNVYAGLAGGYLLRDTAATGIDTGAPDSPLPTGQYELPLIIQDKTILTDGEQSYDGGRWVPEFFGDAPVVNGIAFPYLSVDKGIYRFRVYNGSTARFYRLRLTVLSTGCTLPFFQIGGDGGLLNAPVHLKELTLGPGERADLLVSFRRLRTGERVELGNTAPTPFPHGPRSGHPGGAPLPQIMQFRVSGARGWVPGTSVAGMNLRPVTPVSRLDGAAAAPDVRTRSHSLVEVLGPDGPAMALLNNRPLHAQDYAAPGQVVRRDSLEVWEFANTTSDSHPLHLHLVQFQVLDRQPVDELAYLRAAGYLPDPAGWVVPGSGLYPAPSASPYLVGHRQPPPPNERGWKDTVVAPPGMVTRIAVPFGSGAVPTPVAARAAHVPDVEHGEHDYVWNCHLLDHGENEMIQHFRIEDAPVR